MNEPHEEPLGSAAEEAAKLFGAVAEWAREHGTEWGSAVGGLAAHAAEAAHDVDAHLATGAEECRWCPVCRAVRVFRAASPEVREHLSAAATSMAHAATAMLATTTPERAPGVEHIDLTDEDWPDEDDE